MAIISSEKFKGIMLEISTAGIKISSSNPELGDAMEELDVTYCGEPIFGTDSMPATFWMFWLWLKQKMLR